MKNRLTGAEKGEKRILVPLLGCEKDAHVLYHALSLAERIEGRMFVLRLDACRSGGPEKAAPADGEARELIWEMINGARQAGISVAYYVGEGNPADEIVSFSLREGIRYLVVLSRGKETEQEWIDLLARVQREVPCILVEVPD